MESIWIEKYRPKSLNNIYGNEYVISKLKMMVETNTVTHLLLCGPPGTGKTSALTALAHELLGDSVKTGLLDLNAADDRGIDIVRERIKTFAQEMVDIPANKQKIILLDEVEAMTQSAQQALRRVFELYGSSTRFFLACNQSDKVIEPIQSRCVILQMAPISNKPMNEMLIKICNIEKVKYFDDALEMIINFSEGDCRKAIGILQVCSTDSSTIDSETVAQIIDIPSKNHIRNILKCCENNDWISAYNIVDRIIKNGTTNYDLLNSFKYYINNSEIKPENIFELRKLISEILVRNEREISELKIHGFLANLCKYLYTNNIKV